MRVFNYSEARQKFSTILNTALKEEVIITRKDGSKFQIVPITDKDNGSPFDVEGISVDCGTDEILDVMKESRLFRS